MTGKGRIPAAGWYTAGPEFALPADRGIHHVVAAQAAARPAQCAVVDSDSRSLTYAQLWQRSGDLAATLAQLNVRSGARVAVALGRSLDLTVALLGIARSGAAYVTMDPHSPAERISFILSDASAVICGTDSHDWPIPSWSRRVTVPTGDRPEAAADAIAPAAIDAEEPLYIAYTSGSSGRPRGVVVPHRAVLQLVTEPSYCPLGPDDRVAQLSNPAFDALNFEVWSTLAAGATIVILPGVLKTSLDEWEDLLNRCRITAMFLTTAVFNMIARQVPSTFQGLGVLLFGGEVANPQAVRQVLTAGPPRRLVNVYGPTETTTFATFYDCSAERIAELERIPIGYPLQNTTLYVLDEALRPVRPGDVGELCIGGPGVALGYLEAPELTARKFWPLSEICDSPATGRADRMYRTGDLVRQLPDGAVEFLGRLDRQVKLRGYRVELEEVEQAVRATGLVTGAAVEKVSEGPGAHLVAFVSVGPSESADLPDRLAAALRERLPGYMLPARWVLLSELPLNRVGKIDRQALFAHLAAVEASDAATLDPAPPTLVGEVCELLQELLEVGKVAPTDNFFSLGGNSILAIQLGARLHDRFGVEVEPAEILLTASVAELAERVAAIRWARIESRGDG